MLGIFKKSDKTFKRVATAKNEKEAKEKLKTIKENNPDDRYVIDKLNWK